MRTTTYTSTMRRQNRALGSTHLISTTSRGWRTCEALNVIDRTSPLLPAFAPTMFQVQHVDLVQASSHVCSRLLLSSVMRHTHVCIEGGKQVEREE
mmetsp:Transcript_20764/g.53546  ORF Transcript_20764/g.53546 Transcript_20764/m.53546 type:complete len:96 (+) Transcript_20764:2602-2889(+)